MMTNAQVGRMVLLVLLLGQAWTGPAAAIDRKPVSAAQQVFSWTGPYVGLHVGYGTGDGTSAAVNPAGLLALFPGLDNAASTASAPFQLNASRSGWLGGLQAGYNWQSGHLLLGVEADVSFSGIRGDAAGSYTLHPVYTIGDFDNYAGTVRLKQSIDYFGTLRGRIGYAADNWMLYATGGLAWARVKSSLESSHTMLTANLLINGFPAALNGSLSASGFNVGYAVGGGGEWAFNPLWSVKAEYLYLDVGHRLTGSIPGATLQSGSPALHTVRIGLNRLFGP
jgi:opacity protein-like surface antigen